MTSDRVTGAYMRGRLYLGGVRGKTSVATVCDCLAVFVMDTPGKQLGEWRDGLDRAVADATTRPARPELTAVTQRSARDTWGLEPHQIAQTEHFMQTMGGD